MRDRQKGKRKKERIEIRKKQEIRFTWGHHTSTVISKTIPIFNHDIKNNILYHLLSNVCSNYWLGLTTINFELNLN
jgi:hypothetical protein